jgi:RNA polymerase sigma factor (sigma-70 family)
VDVPQQQEARPEQALIDACIAGNSVAWGRLVAQYAALVYSIPRRYRLPPEACDDIFQEVFAVLLRELPNLRDTRTLPKWLITVAARESLRTARKTASRAHAPPVEPAPLPSEELERLERQQLVRDALEELGDPCKSLLHELFATDSPDYAAIASRLGMPIGSIGPTRGRCLKKLLAIVQLKV